MLHLLSSTHQRIPRRILWPIVLYALFAMTLWFILEPVPRWTGPSTGTYTMFLSGDGIIIRACCHNNIADSEFAELHSYDSICVYDEFTGRTLLDLTARDGITIFAKIISDASTIIHALSHATIESSDASTKTDGKYRIQAFNWKNRASELLEVDSGYSNVALSGDGRWMASMSLKDIQLRDRVGTQKTIHRFASESTDGICQFSPDSRMLWVSMEKGSDRVYAFDVPSLRLIATFPSKGKEALGISAMRRNLYACVDRGITLFDSQTQRIRWGIPIASGKEPQQLRFGLNEDLLGLWFQDVNKNRSIAKIVSWSLADGHINWERTPKIPTEPLGDDEFNYSLTESILHEKDGLTSFAVMADGKSLLSHSIDNSDDGIVPIGIDRHRGIVGTLQFWLPDPYANIRELWEKYVTFVTLPKQRVRVVLFLADLRSDKCLARLSNRGYTFHFTNNRSLVTYEIQSLNRDQSNDDSTFYVWDFPLRKPYARIFLWPFVLFVPHITLFAIRRLRNHRSPESEPNLK